MESLELILNAIRLLLPVFGLIFLLIIVCNWIIFQKAGKPGWAILIPIYGTIVNLNIVGKSGWYIFMFLIPLYGQIVVPIQLTHKLSKVFGHGTGFTLGLLFLPFVFYPILAFSKNTYTAPTN